jgi:hypothetical protein
MCNRAQAIIWCAGQMCVVNVYNERNRRGQALKPTTAYTHAQAVAS